jgi:hypothetical protein
MKSPLLILFFALASVPSAFGSGCNRNDQSGCPAVDPHTGIAPWVDCGAAASSSTPYSIPNTTIMYADGTTSSVSCLFAQIYDSDFPCTTGATFGSVDCLDVFWPTNVDLAGIQWVICYHGGGGFGGYREGCFGAGDTPLVAVESVQKYARRRNRLGGVGVGIVMVDYRLATAIGTNTFPAGAQDAKCAAWWVLANLPSLISGGPQVAPSILAAMGPSWGGNTAWVVGNTSNSFYGTSGTCTAPAAYPSGGFVGASLWPAMSWALPSGNSGYDGNGAAPFTQAIQQQLDSNVLATIRANDAALHGSPCQNITNANAAFLSPNWYFLWGASDTIVQPTWNSGAGGQEVCTMAAYAALSSPMTPTYVIATGADATHEGGLGAGINDTAISNAFEFILGPHPAGWAF